MRKSDVFSTFLQFQTLVERYFSRTIKSIQTDWGGEFRSLPQFFRKIGITHRVAAPHTHEQQGAVEHRQRHITEIGLSLLAHGSVPMSYWHYAFETAVFLINRMPSKVFSGVSLFELVYNKPPSYAFLRIFGCLCFPFFRLYNRYKMEYRSQLCVFFDYSPSHSAYRCLDVKINRTYIARHVYFDESIFPFQSHSLLDCPPPPSSSSLPWGVTSL